MHHLSGSSWHIHKKDGHSQHVEYDGELNCLQDYTTKELIGLCKQLPGVSDTVTKGSRGTACVPLRNKIRTFIFNTSISEKRVRLGIEAFKAFFNEQVIARKLRSAIQKGPGGQALVRQLVVDCC